MGRENLKYTSYEVQLTELGFVCSCADHMYRGVKCKHIHAVEFNVALRKGKIQMEEIIA
jgi:hypothetical protein